MTVLLVLFTLILFLTIDYFVQKARAATALYARDVARSPSAALPLLDLPADTALAVNHTWVRQDRDGLTTIGVDRFLSRLAGRIESFLLPQVGTMVTTATNNISLRQGDKSLEFSSPAQGLVVETNPEVLRNPALVRTDPYGQGWLMRVRPKIGTEKALRSFLIERPNDWMKKQTELAREFFAGRQVNLQFATMQDGGVPSEGLLQSCDSDVWKEFSESFVSLNQAKAHSTPEEK